MKVIYYSKSFFSDCDFPLIRELQHKGIDVHYFLYLWEGNKCQGLLDIKKLKKSFGIFRASSFPEMLIFREYLNLDKIYFINIPECNGGHFYNLYYRIAYKFIHRWVVFKMRMLRADVFHFTWQLHGWERMLVHLPYKKVMTVHDPLSHSNVVDVQEEIDRKYSFSKADHFVLLSDVLSNGFCQKYNISRDRLSFAKLGEFSYLPYIKSSSYYYSKPYVLFFGMISSYKGLEFLCQAMVRIHEKHPDIDLHIVGGGKLYFDFSPYECLDYIHLRNEFLSISELATIVQNALFSVCPYKDATQSGVVQTSFSCNTPMIVTNVGALPKAVQNGVTGLVVPPCDVDALVDAMDKLLSNPILLQTLSENIKNVWRPSMEWTQIAEKYIESWNSKS